VFTLRLDEPGAKAVKVSTSPGSDDGPAYSPDGKWLAFRSQLRAGYESDRFRLMLFDREKKTTKELMPKFDRWVDEFVWTPNSESIYFAGGDAGEEPVFRVSSMGNDLQRFYGVGEFGDLRTTKDGIVATQMSTDWPSKIVYLQSGFVDAFLIGDPGKTRQSKCPANAICDLMALRNGSTLADPNASLLAEINFGETDGGAPAESYWFTGAAGTKVQGFIVRPPNFDPAKKYPLKFLMHGGPQTAWGDAWSYRWNWELMAADGYVVVGVNRRGSTGYGQKFVDEVSGDWGGKAYVDLMKGLDAAEAKFPFIDKTRECALGASYGGYMANWILTHTNRFKCIVTHDGMYNPAAAYGDTEELWFNEWEFRRGPVTGAAAWDKEPAQPWRYEGLPAEQDPFRRWSPMLHMGYLKGKDAKTPTLVIHSQKDYRLDVSEGFQLFTALQRLGVPSKMLYFPDEGHWVLKPQNSQLWYETVGDWCDKWTKTGKYAGK
jgi:dipeptidyl aminopeptidase/acylaminoacyl peptidase